MSSTAFTFNPFAEGFSDDPYPHYAELRAIAPAHEHPLGFWIISRYADVARFQKAGHPVDERHLERLPGWRGGGGTPGRGDRPMRGLSMLDQDPPNHTRLRRLVTKAFTRNAVEALRLRVEALVDEALNRIAEAGQADVVTELAFPIPFTVISELLGIPMTGQSRLRELIGTLACSLEPMPDPGLRAAIRAADEELLAIVADLARWKRAHPGDDVFSGLISAAEDGDVLSEEELVAQVMFLYIAGHETTVNFLAGGILALLRHPDQLQLLGERPELAANAVEELLRYDTPVQLMRRITTEPLGVGGEEIPAGSWVVAALAAANRDPEFWGPDADTLRLSRPNAHLNLSFAAGVHHCLGAPLARLEGGVTFARFARRFPGAVAQDVQWNGRINIRGPASLAIAVR